MQDPGATIDAAIIALIGVVLGTTMSSLISLIVALHNTQEAEKLKSKEIIEQQRNRIQDYVLERLRMIQGVSKPIDHRAELKELFVHEHVRLIGEGLFSKNLLTVWGKDAIAHQIDELEELFYEVWRRRWADTDTGQDFSEYSERVESLSASIINALQQRNQKQLQNRWFARAR